MKFFNIEQGSVVIDDFDSQTTEVVCKVKDLCKLNLDYLELEDWLRAKDPTAKLNGIIQKIEDWAEKRKLAAEYGKLRGTERAFASHQFRGLVKTKEFWLTNASHGYWDTSEIKDVWIERSWRCLPEAEIDDFFGEVIKSEGSFHTTENFVYYLNKEDKIYPPHGAPSIYVSYFEVPATRAIHLP